MLKNILCLFFLFISVSSFAENLSTGEYINYSFDKLADYKYTVNLEVTSGDCDLYGHHSGYPTLSNFHKSSQNGALASESFVFQSTVKSKYFLSIYAFNTCSFSTPTYFSEKLNNTIVSNDSCEARDAGIDTIKDIPCLMNNKGWTLAADLMNYWFSGSGKNYMVELENIKDISIELTEVISQYDKDASNLKIMTPSRWTSLIDTLKTKKNGTGGMLFPDGGKFNFIEKEIPSENEGMKSFQHEKDTMNWINEDIIGDFTLDAYGASIGRGSLRFVTDGEVLIRNGRIEVHVSKVGLYLKDSYDFSTSQYLGFWGYNYPYVTFNPRHDGTYTDNGVFRSYNESLNKSSDFGDFRIYTSMHIINADEYKYIGKPSNPSISTTDTGKKIKLHIAKCLNKFHEYFGDRVGTLYSCNGAVCQNTKGGELVKLTLISIDNNLDGNEFKYLGGGYGGSLKLSYCD